MGLGWMGFRGMDYWGRVGIMLWGSFVGLGVWGVGFCGVLLFWFFGGY